MWMSGECYIPGTKHHGIIFFEYFLKIIIGNTKTSSKQYGYNKCGFSFSTNVDFLSPKNFDQNLHKEKASILLLACNSYYMCSRKIVICIKKVKQYAFLRQAKANQISKKRNNDIMTVNTILQHSPNGQYSMKIRFLSLTTLIQPMSEVSTTEWAIYTVHPLYNLYNFVARTTSLFHTLVFIAITIHTNYTRILEQPSKLLYLPQPFCHVYINPYLF